MNGLGKLFYDNGGIKYTGTFKNGLYEGKGVEFYENGMNKKYKGDFKKGKYHGLGTVYYPDGRVCISGNFENGILTKEENKQSMNFGQALRAKVLQY